MKRLLFLILGVLLLIPSQRVYAEGKSIQPLDSGGNITNNGPRLEITYEEEDAVVYYGSSGIDIIGKSKNMHLDTNFEVLKLISVGDLDGDGYVDFLSYQKAPSYSSQLITLSGKDGHVISSTQVTRIGYHDDLGLMDTNSYIQQMTLLDDKKALIVYDYSFIKIDLLDGSVITKYTDDDNVWKAVEINDVNGDGIKDFVYTGQKNVVGVVSGEDFTLIKKYNIAPNQEFLLPWGNNETMNVTFNMWDILFENNRLFVTSENGHLYELDLSNMEQPVISDVGLNVVNEEAFAQLFQDQIFWESTGRSYRLTGITDRAYNGYRFADSNEEYILIDCYMGDPNTVTNTQPSMHPATVAIVNKNTMEVVATLSVDNYNSLYQKSCFAEYKGQTVVMFIGSCSEGLARVYLYSLGGELLLQKELRINNVDQSRLLSSHWDGERIVLEVFGYGVAYINSDLKVTGYGYNATSGNLIYSKDDLYVVLYNTNGKKDRIVGFDSDLKTVKWTYRIPTHYANNGIENLKVDFDYNGDGYKDIAFIIQELKNDSPMCSIVYVLNSKNGSSFWADYFVTSKYWENGKQVINYLVANDITPISDTNGDGKKELSLSGTVVSSKSKEIIGNVAAGIDTKGQLFKVGDINKDGLDDHVAITSSEARLYVSSIKVSYGEVSAEYVKQNIAKSLNSKNDPVNTTVLFGDLNKDGISELGIVERDNANHQVYRILNGANLSVITTLCPDGINDDGEAFAVLNFDLNGDGYNEIYGRDNWKYGIYDGKTGEKLVSTTMYSWQEENVDMNDYYPDYTVPFTILDEAPNFFLASNMHEDNKQILAINRAVENRETWTTNYQIDLVNVENFETIDIINYGQNYSDSGVLTEVKNTNRYVFLVGDTNGKIVDLLEQTILASFEIKIKEASYFDEEHILITDSKDKMYLVDITKSFELVNEIPSESNDHILNLAWKTSQDYSTMTISDNGKVVYTGNDDHVDIPLVEGQHTILMAVNDGQGKTSQRTYEVNVAPQARNYVPLIISISVLVVLSFLLGIYQKISINNKFKKEAAK